MSNKIDGFGNINADEGCTRCVCGCKYWENDYCVSCGISVERSFIIETARASRFLFEMWLNVQVSTMTYYDLGWTDYVPAVGDAVEIHEKYRALGVLR
jgi:hypothetical protein